MGRTHQVASVLAAGVVLLSGCSGGAQPSGTSSSHGSDSGSASSAGSASALTDADLAKVLATAQVEALSTYAAAPRVLAAVLRGRTIDLPADAKVAPEACRGLLTELHRSYKDNPTSGNALLTSRDRLRAVSLSSYASPDAARAVLAANAHRISGCPSSTTTTPDGTTSTRLKVLPLSASGVDDVHAYQMDMRTVAYGRTIATHQVLGVGRVGSITLEAAG